MSLVLLLCTAVSAQDKSDSTTHGKKTSVHSLYAGAGYGSNMIYMGSNVSADKPFYSGSLTYGFKDELFFSASSSHLSAFDPFIAFSTFTLSYNHDFNSWLDISLSASRYQVNSQLTDTLFNNFFYGSLAIGLDWKILYTSLSAGAVISESSSAYLNLRNSRYFQTPALSGGKAFFYFDPYVNLLFGTLTKTENADGTTVGVSAPFKTKNSSTHGGGGGSSVKTTTYFSLMEADFGIPVGFTIGRLSIEAEPGYVLPAYSGSDIQSPEGFTLLLNMYFNILKGK